MSKQTDRQLLARVYDSLNYILLPVLFVQGLLLLDGGEDHLTAPGWVDALQIPGGVWTWSLTLTGFATLGVLGLLMGLHRGCGRRLVWASYALLGLWFFVLGIFFVISVKVDVDGNFTGPGFWWLFAILFGQRGIVYSDILSTDDGEEDVHG